MSAPPNSLTMREASLRLYNLQGKQAGIITAAPGGRYRVRALSLDAVFDTQNEAVGAGARAIREEGLAAKAAKKRTKANTRVGATS
jgi:hypothetical protein